MKTLLTISMLLISTPVLAEKMFAYYDEPDTAEEQKIIRSIPGKIICFYVSPFKNNQNIRISKMIDDDKECPLVLDLSTPEPKKEPRIEQAETETKVEKK